MLGRERTFELFHQRGGLVRDLAKFFQIFRAMKIEYRPNMQKSTRGMTIVGSLKPERPHDPSNPRTYSGNCAGRTAASSINATGFFAPTHPVSNDNPALRTDQTRSISRALVRIFERNPSLRACKIARRSATFSS